MDRFTGKPVEGTGHLAQSLGDLLSTPIGSRTERRDYGSMLPDLIDQPLNSATTLLIYASTALAIRAWEPRLRLRRVGLEIDRDAGSQAAIRLEGERTDLDQPNSRVVLSIPIRAGGASPAYA